MNKTIGVFAIAAVLSGAPPARADALVVLDYWWLRDYAKESCREVWIKSQPERRSACSDIAANINVFSSRLETQFAMEALCHGISFLAYSGPNKNTDRPVTDASRQPHWTLIIDYKPGPIVQEWGLEAADEHFAGAGDPNSIAREVCALVTGQGGSILR